MEFSMSTMNISLPEPLKKFVDERVANAGYGTSSEYLRELIRRDQDKLYLRSLLTEGINAPITGEPDARYFSRLREYTKRRLSQQPK